MRKAEKPFFVENLAQELASAKSVVLVDYQGLPNVEQNRLRATIKAVGGKLLVVKNTLLKLALEKSQITTHKSQIEKVLTGPTALVIAEHDELAPLQAIGRFIQEFEKPALKVGIIGGVLYDTEKLLAFSRLAGREVLLGQLLDVISGPTYGLVGTLNANLQKLIWVLNLKIKQYKEACLPQPEGDLTLLRQGYGGRREVS